jgi:glycosyltransferase involved in cell wall biosynthesis
MKIAIESTTIGPKFTGTNRFLNCLIEQLTILDNDILYFNPIFKSKSQKYIPDSLKRHYYRQFNLKKEIEKSTADCGIFPDYFMPHNFNKPAAVVIHDLSFITHPQFYSKRFVKYYTYQVKETLEQNPLILTVSAHTKNNIIKYLGAKEENIHIVQGYSKMQQNKTLHNLISENNIPYFLYVGHIEPRKNLKFLVEGFREWKKGLGININLKIVGEMWIKSPELVELIAKCQNDSDVEFMGYVSDEHLENIYYNASGFIHTSFEEGFGFPVLEAMKFNLPIICTRGIATAEISSPISIPVNPNDKLSYYNGLERMLSFVINNERPEYNIKYSPSLMKEQLSVVIDGLEFRIKKVSSSVVPRTATCEEALEKTLVYSGMFNSGIKAEKIHEQLFDREIRKEDLERIIERYKDANIITEINGYLLLNNRVKGYYQKSRNGINKKKIKKILGFLNKVPLISLIAFSGGTAHYGLENHDDIDLFIITKPYSIYIVYFIIHLYSLIFNARKELCANFLIDETKLEIMQSYDFFTAHQIITLSGFRNNKMLNHFISMNSWIKSFFPNFSIRNEEFNKSGKGYFILKPFNLALMFFYKMLYKYKLAELGVNGSLVLKENCLKLHSNDNRYKIINEFQRTWNEYRVRKDGMNKKQKYLALK